MLVDFTLGQTISVHLFCFLLPCLFFAEEETVDPGKFQFGYSQFLLVICAIFISFLGGLEPEPEPVRRSFRNASSRRQPMKPQISDSRE